MNEIWARIEAWLALNAPLCYAGLRPGASAELIQQTELALGVTFPEDVRHFYRRHDGQDCSSPGFLHSWEFLSLARVLAEYDCWKDLVEGGEFAGITSDGGDAVSTDWYNLGWIPLTGSGSGDSHCLDLNPGPEGTLGQIITMWHDDSVRPVEASSLREWLEQFADDLEAGEYIYSEEYGGVMPVGDLY